MYYAETTKRYFPTMNRGVLEAATLHELAQQFAEEGTEAFSIEFANGVPFSPEGVKWFNSKIEHPEYAGNCDQKFDEMHDEVA